jgi:hypothetical protein
VARDASGNFSAGTITATLSGAATSATTATNLAGGAANRIAYQTGAGATTFAVAPTASNQVLNWNGSAFTWSAGTISGVALGSNLNTLTFGTYLTGTSYNGSGAVTLATNATNANTASTLVARDASGNFSAGTITAALSGNATTATSATSATSAGNLTGGTISGNYVVNNATSPNSFYLQFGDNTGWTYRFMTSVAGTPTTRFSFGDNGNFTAVGTVAGTNITTGGNVTGNAATVTNGVYTTGAQSIAGVKTFSDTPIFSGGTIQVGSSAGTYRRFRFDGTISSDGTNFYTLLNSNNYTSYSPSLTGSGASGTWGINVTGSATSLNSSNFISQTGSSGNYNTDFTNTPVGTFRYNGDSAGATNNPGGSWWLVQNMRHTNASSSWGTQVAWGWEDNANRLATRNVTSGSFGAWVYYLNSSNVGTYALPISGGTLTGQLTTRVTSGTTPIVSGGGSNSFQVMGDVSNGAWMSFHRGGAYAVNLGMDTSNVVSLGGWSDGGTSRWTSDTSGNFVARGNVTAYSDERLKKDWAPVAEDFIAQLAKVKHGTYTRTDSEERQMGVSAQAMRTFAPEAVLEDSEGRLSLAYGNAALVAAVKLAERVVALEARLAALEAKG